MNGVASTRQHTIGENGVHERKKKAPRRGLHLKWPIDRCE